MNGEKDETAPNFKLQYLRNQCRRGGTGYGDIDFKAYSMILGGFRGNPLKIRVLRSCSENLVQLR